MVMNKLVPYFIIECVLGTFPLNRTQYLHTSLLTCHKIPHLFHCIDRQPVFLLNEGNLVMKAVFLSVRSTEFRFEDPFHSLRHSDYEFKIVVVLLV